jgi:hypothetical protein
VLRLFFSKLKDTTIAIGEVMMKEAMFYQPEKELAV